MPAVLLERIPLPSLQTYTAFTALLLACAAFYAHQVVTGNVELPVLQEGDDPPLPAEEGEGGEGVEGVVAAATNLTLPYDSYKWNFYYVMTREVWCIWTLVNAVYCCLIVLGKVIQHLVFGELRVSEQQHLKDKFWNFVFYKFIFIFGVMNVQNMYETLRWVALFSALGFLSLLTQLTRDRFEYLSFSPTTSRRAHGKLLGLLVAVLTAALGLLLLCAYVCYEYQYGLTTFAFMASECLLLWLKTLYALVRYGLHLWDLSQEGVWENRSSYVYYTELVFELALLSVDFAHHLHMLLWGNIFLSMASLVICMQLRFLFYELQRRIRRHKNYLYVVRHMEAKFPMATSEELEANNDDCAICWEKMDSARKLPCNHLFHNSCLRSWLEQDTSCPTCRTSLSDRPAPDRNGNPANAPNGDNNNPPPAAERPNAGTTNHFFHFDGSRYVSWLPSFSVEVTHTTNLLPPTQQRPPIQTSQLDNMARQVQTVFPEMPLASILEDLHVTRSVDLTIDNILEGRLVYPGRPGAPALQLLPAAAAREVEDSAAELAPSGSPVAMETSSPTLAAAPLQPVQAGIAGDSLPLLAEELETEREGVPSASGSRFSKSAAERMSMLEQRKTAMLEQARRRYLQSQAAGGGRGEPQSSPATSTSTSSSAAPGQPAAASTDEGSADQTEAGGRGTGDSRPLLRHRSLHDDHRQQQRSLILEATQRRLSQSGGGSSSSSGSSAASGTG